MGSIHGESPMARWLDKPMSRQTALDAVEGFVPKAGQIYRSKRNFDLGIDRNIYVSRLSPFLRHRIISEPEVVRAVLQEHSYKESEKFLQEVCWHTYWKGWLEHRPQVWSHYLKLNQEYHPSGEERNRLENALQGKTGIAAFDTWTKELVNTGYLHNHARMWFASIWCFTLKLPWYRGAQFFYENLLDGDPAANTLSWRWVVGLHTKGKTYQAKKSNIETYTDGRFSPDGLAETSWVPEDKQDNDICYEVSPLSAQPESGDHLIVWPDDWSVDIYFKDFKPQSVAMIHPHWESPKRAHHVKDYQEAAFTATLRRLQTLSWNCSVIKSRNDLQSYLTQVKDQPISWMKPFVGEGRDLLDQLQPLFDGHRTRELRRAWDDFFFPKAKKGFFTLKKSIPKAVANLDQY